MTMSAAALGLSYDWQDAVRQALAQVPGRGYELVTVFVHPDFEGALPGIAREVQAALAPGLLIGCTGQGVISTAREVEGAPAVSIAAFALPGATLTAVPLLQQEIASLPDDAAAWRRLLQVAPTTANAWLLIADPFSVDVDRLIAGLAVGYPGTTVSGGLASGRPTARRTRLLLGERALDEGAIAVAIGGAWTVQTLVSQGAEPLGDAWTVTSVDGAFLETIGGRPAIEVLRDALNALPPDERERAARNLLVGLAMNEYSDTFGRGDFLIRNVHGFHPQTGAIAIGDRPRAGQTVQFQVRDARAADDELRAMLESARESATSPAGALLFSCNGRGVGLFGTPDHDAAAVAEVFGELPVAGFFCNGEIGPVGGRTFVHGFTASIAFFVPANTRAADPPEVHQ